MIDKAEGKTGEGEGEELLAGKYKTTEDLLNGTLEILKGKEVKDLETFYKTLESELGKPKDTEGKEKEEVPDGKDEGKAEGTLDFNTFVNEIQEKGELSAESMETLKAQGFPEELINSYVEGQQALIERSRQTFFNTVGGQENYEAMIKWASTNLSQEEIDTFNKAVTTDMDIAKLATEALYSKYVQANGKAPEKLIMGAKGVQGTSSGRYESLEQMKADMADPKYAKDPAFRKMVQEKLAKSNIL